MSEASSLRLANTGPIYVTVAAARTFAAVEGIQIIEEARHELAERLRDATENSSEPGKPEKWRARSRSSGLDITAHVVREEREGQLAAVVVAVRVRDWAGGSTRGRGRGVGSAANRGGSDRR